MIQPDANSVSHSADANGQKTEKPPFKPGSEQRYEGLISSLRHSRNRLLFFVLFAVYNLLAILGTTDKMLFMAQGVKMPLLNIELPLLAFYVSMPFFLLALQFNLLYTYKQHRKLLLETEKKDKALVQALPFGLYEGALLERGGMVVRVTYAAMMVLLYVLAPMVLLAFWFRFADYQSLPITTLHLVLLGISVFVSLFFFSGLLRREDSLFVWLKEKWFRWVRFGFVLLVVIVFSGVVGWYQKTIVVPIAQKEVILEDLENLQKQEQEMNEQLNSFIPFETWFLPRITLQGELLVEADKETLELLQQMDKEPSAEENPLLHYLPPKDFSKRKFRLAEITECVLPKAKFAEAGFQKANLQKTQLQGASLRYAQLQGANLYSAQLQRADLGSAQLQEVDLSSAQLQGANLYSAQLQGADLSSAQLQGADLRYAELQGADLSSAQLQGADLSSAELQGADLSSAQLQGANLYSAQLQGADLSSAQLQGADLRYAELQGADLSSVQLQGVQTISPDKGNPVFHHAKGKSANFSGLSTTTLDEVTAKKRAEALQEKLQPYLDQGWLSQEWLDQIKNRMINSVGMTSRQWVEQQTTEGQRGVLTEEMFNEIAASVTEPKARKRMGLPPLESEQK